MTTNGEYFVQLVTPFFVSFYHLRVSFDGSSFVLVQVSQTFSTKYVKFFGKKDNFSSYGSRKTLDNDSLQMTEELNGNTERVCLDLSPEVSGSGHAGKRLERKNSKLNSCEFY